MRILHSGLIVGLSILLLSACGKNTEQAKLDNNNPGTPGGGQHVFDGSCDMGGTPFGGGNGSSSSPYLICTAAQLNNISVIDYSSSSFVLVDNLDLANVNVQQVGNFTGTFDGNGKTLSNWTGYAPLFVNLTGTVQNLSIRNANVTGSYRVGMVAGTTTSTAQIINTNVSGNISTSYQTGGLVGFNAGKITGCTASVVITGTDHIGGLVGVNSGIITSSSASGSVTATTSKTTVGLAGGLISQNVNGTITSCSANVSVSGQDSSGGFIGDDYKGTISNSYALGAVNGNNGVGGFIGSTMRSTISDCFATGRVQAASQAAGFAGINGSAITRSYSAGVVASAGAQVGGFAGVNQATDTNVSPAQTVAGTVSASYWDMQASGQSASAAGTGSNTASMQSASTYVGWNFSTVWNAPAGGYPTLR